MTYKVSQLSISPENTVFHYVHLDLDGEGVFLAPLSPPDTPLHSQLLHNFRAACQIMHANFESRARLQSLASGNSKFGVGRSFPATLLEQGSLFQWTPRGAGDKTLPMLSYWVCGRLLEGGRKCYVSYHESAPQVMVELAFRLAHGVHL